MDRATVLADAIQAARTRPFAYGSFDCCLFCADVVLAMTGLDYAAELRGYESEKDAYRIVARYGSIEAMVTALLKKEPGPVAMARRGDVVLADMEGRETLGICVGVHSAFPQAVGLRFMPTSSARCAWRIG